MSMILPDDLLHQILIKLPVKSLLRFRCVSKSWYSLISNSDFMLDHLHHNQIAGNSNVLFRKYLTDSETEIFCLHSDNEEFQEIETLHCPFKSYFENFTITIIGCANGLICLEDMNTLMFWNPSIRKCLTLPDFEIDPLSEETLVNSTRLLVLNSYCGFGYDALSNDFKVVKIKFYKKAIDSTIITTVAVFSLRDKSWRRIPDYSARFEFCSRWCNVSSFVYWVRPLEDCRVDIVSFDLSTETFTEIPCPEDVFLYIWCCNELANLRDSLALIAQVHGRDGVKYHIWVMREEGVVKSWMKLYSVVTNVGVSRPLIVGFSKKGLMLVVGEGGFLVTPVVEDAQVANYVPSGPQSAWYVESYTESLFLLLEGDNIPLSLPNSGNGQWQASGSNAKLKEYQ